HHGTLFVATWGGGVMRLGRTGALEKIPPASTSREALQTTALATFDGRLVVASAGAGLARLEGDAFAPFASARAPRNAWALAVHGDALWDGGLEGVASIPRTGPARHEADFDARAIAPTSDGVLLGTYGSGVVRVAGHAPSPEGAA